MTQQFTASCGHADNGWGGLKVRPNFMIIGAAKCGTSSLWTYLNQHPEVFLSGNKEPNYYALRDQALPEPGPRPPDVMRELLYSFTVTDFAEYSALFQSAGGAKAIGEASVRYLYTPGTAERIHASLPDLRLIVMLRDPVKRLYSHYCMNRQYDLEPLPLMEAVEMESERKKAGWGYDWHYVGVGRYAEQVKNYLDWFPRERVGMFLFEDFARDPVAVVQEIYRFLGVDDAFVPNVSLRKKASYRPRSFALDAWVNPPGKEGRRRRAESLGFLPGKLRGKVFAGINLLNRAPVARLAESDRLRLKEHFSDDIAETTRLLGRDPGWW